MGRRQIEGTVREDIERWGQLGIKTANSMGVRETVRELGTTRRWGNIN